MLLRLAERLVAVIMSINLMNKISKAPSIIDKCIKLVKLLVKASFNKSRVKL